MVYTREQLASIGMDEGQINAILNTQAAEQTNVVQMPVKKEEKVYTENDITSIDDIVKYSAGTIVRLPDFADGAPFIAKLKRPSMLKMVSTGKIPNNLVTQATQLFKSGAGSLGKGNTVDDLLSIMELICEEAMVKPKYSEIKEKGITLSDDQMMAIFSYTQQGIKALEQFR